MYDPSPIPPGAAAPKRLRRDRHRCPRGGGGFAQRPTAVRRQVTSPAGVVDRVGYFEQADVRIHIPGTPGTSYRDLLPSACTPA